MVLPRPGRGARQLLDPFDELVEEAIPIRIGDLALEPLGGDLQRELRGFLAKLFAGPAQLLIDRRARRMVPRGSGLIVLLVPAASDDPEAAPLRAARAAVVGLAEGLSEEWGPAGVAVEWIEEAPSDELRERLLRAAAGARIVRDPSVPPREGGS